MKHQTTILCTAAFTMHLFTASTTLAQPPAQGPAPASSKANSLPASLVTGIVTDTVNKSIAAQNAALATNADYRAVLSMSFQTWSPYMMSTQYMDRPNQFYAHSAYMFTYTVNNIKAKVAGLWISYPFSRTISQSIDVHTTCEGWQNGRGTLSYSAVINPPYLEGDHSFVESAFGALLNGLIPDYVDSQIRAGLKSSPSGITTPTSSGIACNTLGVATTAQGFPYDSINYDVSPFVPHTGILPEISVQILGVRRLPLHRFDGSVLYNAVETPYLDFYAGFAHTQFELPSMVEGQTWIPQGKSVLQTPVPSASGLLVLIGDITYQVGAQEDSSWATFGSSTNFGNGIQTLKIMKTWFEPPVNGGKPIKRIGAGYEVTVKITSPAMQVLSH